MVFTGSTRTLFSVQAEFEPNTLSRVLELFAVRGLTYDTMSARHTGDGLQWIELHCQDVEDQHAGILLNKLKQIITVKHARVETTILAA
jgi:acetolactate synthase regulatory subunit